MYLLLAYNKTQPDIEWKSLIKRTDNILNKLQDEISLFNHFDYCYIVDGSCGDIVFNGKNIHWKTREFASKEQALSLIATVLSDLAAEGDTVTTQLKADIEELAAKHDIPINLDIHMQVMTRVFETSQWNSSSSDC